MAYNTNSQRCQETNISTINSVKIEKCIAYIKSINQSNHFISLITYINVNMRYWNNTKCVRLIVAWLELSILNHEYNCNTIWVLINFSFFLHNCFVFVLQYMICKFVLTGGGISFCACAFHINKDMFSVILILNNLFKHICLFVSMKLT